jgi:uncharacterized membrane protein
MPDKAEEKWREIRAQAKETADSNTKGVSTVLVYYIYMYCVYIASFLRAPFTAAKMFIHHEGLTDTFLFYNIILVPIRHARRSERMEQSTQQIERSTEERSIKAYK